MSIQFKEQKPALLEQFGVYYLGVFRKKDLTHRAFDFSDGVRPGVSAAEPA
jgi:hypothetical protein